ncbi:phage tail assembly protein [Roseobacter sp. HKCCD9010]|uniref:phage tail assembly protein n=1 Tax=unclassified Roseobacter TaxID=196798 RepID=UPI00149225A2|nr:MULTISPECIES: phage tail assembly protein [unclassified Roseobacter]MBF9049876.1 phage tail assembly protein [Rhodobacterales bacterium HKCCD4356]NNV13585.1 phage tail assembly protein [Roseobacter sp. HKCCD7357]NNV16419.1 phage tail assembly protein [Roseobacter sp. HKCCD8768]NNV25878.1 phage tail assembly protein [Roseobacter sp. HKCCD8192]NNV30136.1 phage tail assembly protein [Roseobacter sp. HKCCD9061]
MTKKKHDVTLSAAVKIDGKDVTGIDLRKPQTGELRGLKMTDVLQMDTDAMIKLLPRITQPPLTSAQVAALDPADFVALCGKTVLFFAKKSELQALEANT